MLSQIFKSQRSRRVAAGLLLSLGTGCASLSGGNEFTGNFSEGCQTRFNDKSLTMYVTKCSAEEIAKAKREHAKAFNAYYSDKNLKPEWILVTPMREKIWGKNLKRQQVRVYSDPEIAKQPKGVVLPPKAETEKKRLPVFH